MVHTTKIITTITANMWTEGINIAITTANIISPKYAAIYPLRLVTCLPFMVIVVPVEKLIMDTSNNIPNTINSIVFFFIVMLDILTNAWVPQSAKWMLLSSKSLHLNMQHRQSQPLPFIFTLESFLSPYGYITPVTFMLGLLFCRKA